MGALGQPSLLGFVLACALWLLLGVVPGVLVATWLAPDRSRLERVAVAPLISIALGFAPASWLSALGVPQARHAAWAVPLLVSTVLLVALGRRGDLRALAARSRTATLVGLACLASTAVWLLGISLSRPGWASVVPDQDGSSHGVFVARILLTGSVSPDRVAAFDLADPGAVTVFYPLGVHALAAPIAELTSVASALLVPLTVLGSVALIVGSAALGRRVGGERLVVPSAVTAAVLVPWFPFAQTFWGPVPMVLALACVPGLVLALVDARGRGGLLVAVLAVAGMLAAHTTELLVAAAIALLAVLLGEVRQRGLGVLHVVAAVVAGSVVVAPLAAGLLSGGASRPQELPRGGDALAVATWAALRPTIAFEAWATSSPALLGAAVIAGVAVASTAAVGACRLRRSPLALSVTAAVVACLVVAATARAGVLGLLSFPWYGNADRLASQAAALLPVLVGSGWVWLQERESAAARSAASVGAAAVAVVLVAQAASSVVDDLTRCVAGTPYDRAAYQWLATQVAPGERVLNDHRDGSVWMYEATSGAVAPVFGPKPSGGWELSPYFDRAVRLRDHVLEIGADAQVRADAAALGVRFILVGSRRFEDVTPQLDAEAMERSAAFREVYRSGGARVFEIVAG